MAAGNGRRNGLAITFSPSLRTGTFLRTLPLLRRAPRLRDQIRGVLAGFRILGGGSLASSLDLRCTRKSALDLPPGKLRSDPPSFGCSAACAPCGGRAA